ncbi:MAG: DUF134 domain-containing protein [Clostridiales bacterium]|nr:DUF134 domain-containing protein [Clostridiales bacterium]
MARPMKGRSVCCLPRNARFGPLEAGGEQEAILMSVDEFETIRLIDYENMTQEECAEQMGVARTTVQGIYDQARKKVARSLVDARPLTITGGQYVLYGDTWDGEGCRAGACRRHRQGSGQGGQGRGQGRGKGRGQGQGQGRRQAQVQEQQQEQENA